MLFCHPYPFNFERDLIMRPFLIMRLQRGQELLISFGVAQLLGWLAGSFVCLSDCCAFQFVGILFFLFLGHRKTVFLFCKKLEIKRRIKLPQDVSKIVPLRLVQTRCRSLWIYCGLSQQRDRTIPISLQKCKHLSQVAADLQRSVNRPLSRES